MAREHFTYFVIGGGSGGVASARRAAGYGAKVGLAEGERLGGTCVNVGCIPKKMMWWCSTIGEMLKEAHHYGFSVHNVQHSWIEMKKARDSTISRLNGIYAGNLDASKVSRFGHHAKFLGQDNGNFLLQVGPNEITAENVLIATGGTPIPLGMPGQEYCINSDSFFDLKEAPKKIAVLGAGYIAVELASVCLSLCESTHLFTRGAHALRKFDKMIGEALHQHMTKQGCVMHPVIYAPNTCSSGSIIESVTRDATTGLLSVKVKNGEVTEGFTHVLCAIGRRPMVDHLNLDALSSLKTDSKLGVISVNPFQETSIPHVFALGDVCGEVELTPMAIAAGRRLADRLFGGMPNAKADYLNVPTVIFTHPTIGSIGLSEEQAKSNHGEANIRVYSGTSVNLYYSAFSIPPQEKPKTFIKLVCNTMDDDRILGMHIFGMGADEMLQGFGVAIKMGAKKSDLDNCIAIHPTAAEEVVTLPPWGLSAL